MFRVRQVLVILMVVALVAAGLVLAERVGLEESNRTVELVIDLTELAHLARLEAYDLTDLLRELKGAGITSVAVSEKTIAALHLEGAVSLYSGTELMAMATTLEGINPVVQELLASGGIQSGWTYVLTEDSWLAAWLEESLSQRLGPDRVRLHQGEGNYLLEARVNKMRLVGVELGFLKEELETVARMGFHVVPRPANFAGVGPEEIKEVFSTLATFDVSTVVFSGTEILGYPDHLEVTAAQLGEHGFEAGLIEDWEQMGYLGQAGVTKLSRLLDFRTVRVFSLSPEKMRTNSPPEMVQIWLRAVKERKVRLLYLRPFLTREDGGLVATNVKYFGLLRESLLEAGFRPGPAVPFRGLEVGPLFTILVSLGIMAGALVLLGMVFPVRDRTLFLLTLVGVGFTLISYPLGGELVRKAFALGAAVVFPTLGVTSQVKGWMARQGGTPGKAKVVWGAVLSLVKAAGLTAVGAVYISSLLASTPYLTAWEVFRGVKVSYLLPPLAVLLVSWRYYQQQAFPQTGEGRHRFWDRLVELGNHPVTVGNLVLIGLVMLALVVYVARSGNTLLPVPELELRVRSFLENIFLVRPRTKEFLIGHPALMAAVAAARWRREGYVPVLAALGTIGQVSLINSFEHLHSPLLVSVIRGSNGLVLGILVGILVAAVAAVMFERVAAAGSNRGRSSLMGGTEARKDLFGGCRHG